MLVVHHPLLKGLIKSQYSASELQHICLLLERFATFKFNSLENGLFPASGDKSDVSGYHYVWVRDNVFVAHAHYVNGYVHAAVVTTKALATYFKKYIHRFQDIIDGRVSADDPMQRPNVRFDGNRLEELSQKWPHAQNDALGYFLWLYARLTCSGHMQPTQEDMALLATFTRYFQAIRYWEDEDSGHWEESRKVSASSIGIVVGALQALRDLYELKNKDTAFLIELMAKGRAALDQILPNECSQEEPNKRRDCDAALLFLIYPIDVVNKAMANLILERVCNTLQGDYGIRRYQGDSYWCADYKTLMKPEERTADFSDRMKERDALLKVGQEAQWCIFDPIISIIYGHRYYLSKNVDDLDKQINYFNRSLGQLTAPGSIFGECQCPEAYYLEDGHYVPNDNTPLLWTQANLWAAIKMMTDNLI